MSCQGDDSTEETPPGAGHLGASHARFKSSVSWLGGVEGCKTGVNVPCQSWDRGAAAQPPGCWLSTSKVSSSWGNGARAAPWPFTCFPAAFFRSKFHFKAITLECFPIMTAGLLFSILIAQTWNKAHSYGLQENSDESNHCSKYKLTSQDRLPS